MRKPKFDQLFEAAVGGLNAAGPANDLNQPGVAPAADDQVDDFDVGGDEGEDTVTLTISRAAAQELHDLLMNVLGGEEDELAVDDGTDGEEPVVAEEVDAEDLGHPLHNLKKGHPDKPTGSNQVGDLKKNSGTANTGKFRNEPEPKAEKGNTSGLTGKNNKVGSGTVASVGKRLFD